jgi:hypothetical protein
LEKNDNLHPDPFPDPFRAIGPPTPF